MRFKTDEDYIAALERERDNFIIQNPKLRGLQNWIDSELSGIKNPIERAKKMSTILVEKLTTELLPARAELRKIKAVVDNMALEVETELAATKIDIGLELVRIQ